ncbi:hypothetical protein HN011_000877 [Eciton burchellii]|nr:hypothetical protein HN011_000877 [Eciton burchellii]
MSEDDSSKWEEPHYPYPERGPNARDSFEQSVAACVSGLRLAFSRRNREPVPPGTRQADLESRNYAPFIRNRALDVTPNPYPRDSPSGRNETAAHRFHLGGRSGKLSSLREKQKLCLGS